MIIMKITVMMMMGITAYDISIEKIWIIMSEHQNYDSCCWC